MAIYTATQGEVVGAPVQVTTDTGGITVLVLRDTSSAGPREPGEPVAPAVEYEVCMREPRVSRQVLRKVRLGDRLVVLGTLQLDVVAGPLEDALSAARIRLEAIAIGLELGSQDI
jgi:hypothetical protein